MPTKPRSKLEILKDVVFSFSSPTPLLTLVLDMCPRPLLVILSALPGDSTWLAVSRLGQASLVTLTSSLERVRRVETGLYFSLPVVQLTI